MKRSQSVEPLTKSYLMSGTNDGAQTLCTKPSHRKAVFAVTDEWIGERIRTCGAHFTPITWFEVKGKLLWGRRINSAKAFYIFFLLLLFLVLRPGA